ncbi:MAG: hypothetical protein HY904_26435 [Deltaproteobacteria bacterium]|nr:hypothetical protein [Deltaproteobacteria bacterium]
MRLQSLRVTMCVLCLAAGACSYKVVTDHRLNAAGAEKLLSDVERIRGLKATAPLRMSMEGRARLKSGAQSDLHRVSYLQHMEDLAVAWTKVGLVPPGTDLAGAFASVGTEAPAGYYETTDGILRIIDRQNPRSEIIELTGMVRQRDLVDGEVLSHEMTHALQDMHFGLDRFLSSAPNDDAALARRCLAEGDASFVGYAYSSVFTPSMESWLRFVESRTGALDVAGAPDFVNRRFQMPYLQGARFVGLVHKKGGWAAVNAAYRDPPASTEEILHPERYLRGRDRPRDIRLPPLMSFLGEGWREIWQEAVGELGLRTVWQREQQQAGLRGPSAVKAAEGWDGDRAAVYVRNGVAVLAWKMGFDSDEDAREGHAAYRAMAGRYPGFTVVCETPERVVARTGDAGVMVERRGLSLLVLEGFPPETQEAAAEAAWAASDGNAFDPPAQEPK